MDAGTLVPGDTTALTQIHCHERSLGDPQDSADVLAALGVHESRIETGCCGLAGNWGFEKGHAEMSLALGERELFPKVREATGEVIADGFSCRTQISQGTGRTKSSGTSSPGRGTAPGCDPCRDPYLAPCS